MTRTELIDQTLLVKDEKYPNLPKWFIIAVINGFAVVALFTPKSIWMLIKIGILEIRILIARIRLRLILIDNKIKWETYYVKLFIKALIGR